MPECWEGLVTAMKQIVKLPITTGGKEETLPVAEEQWNTRPDIKSYGIISFDYEANALNGDSLKLDRAYEGSFDLYSYDKTGDGWIELIEQKLAEFCGSCWSLNSHQRETETSLHHWEWIFQVR